MERLYTNFHSTALQAGSAMTWRVVDKMKEEQTSPIRSISPEARTCAISADAQDSARAYT